VRAAVLIPAFNEAERIGATVGAVLEVGLAGEPIVIDDGSTDGTADAARSAGARVVSLARNRGKGAALDEGLAAAGETWDILVMLDGDLGGSAAQASLLVEPVMAGTADMTIARFPAPQGKAGFGIVKNTARRGIRELGSPSFDAQAPLSGQRAMNRRCVQAVTPFAFGYGVEVALTVRALRAGLMVVEVPTTMSHAATGRDLSGFYHRGRQYLHVRSALRALAREDG
jgi:glycosyltransferase involved in cell wall biosynthesis